MKVMTILGTRPDIIKLSEIIKKFDAHTQHILVHTGQNHDYELNEIFFEQLGVRKPDYFLDIADKTLGRTISKLMTETENVLQAEEPDAVVILGDTNSALSSIIVKRRKIPLFHLEAGNRCFDDNVPEEVNRRIIDHISDVNLVFSENARRYLLAEGVAKERIFLMGSPMREVLNRHYDQVKKSRVLKQLGLKPKRYYLASIHRDENTEIDANLVNIVLALGVLAESTKTPVLLPLHPRTRNKFEQKGVKLHPGILTHKPFGFLDYCQLQLNAACVISDSGTLAEESALLNFPAVTLRSTFERPEAVDAGSIILCQPDAVSLMTAVAAARVPDSAPRDYLVDNCSERVLRTVIGYTGYVNKYIYHR